MQFFIVRDDAIGRAFKEALLRQARAGVRIYYLMDIIGCLSRPTTGTYEFDGRRVDSLSPVATVPTP